MYRTSAGAAPLLLCAPQAYTFPGAAISLGGCACPRSRVLGFPKALRGVPHVSWVAVAPEGKWHNLAIRGPHTAWTSPSVRTLEPSVTGSAAQKTRRFLTQEWSHHRVSYFRTLSLVDRGRPLPRPPPACVGGSAY